MTQTNHDTELHDTQTSLAVTYEGQQNLQSIYDPITLRTGYNGNVPPTFEEQLLIDRQQQLLKNRQQFHMIQNIKYSKSGFRRKAASIDQDLKGRYASQLRAIQSEQTSLMQDYTSHARQISNGAQSALHVNWSRQNNSRHKLIRKPDYTLHYSASGNQLPRRAIPAKPAQHYFLGSVDGGAWDEEKASTLMTQAHTSIKNTRKTNSSIRQNSNKSFQTAADRRKAIMALKSQATLHNSSEYFGRQMRIQESISGSQFDGFLNKEQSMEDEIPRCLQNISLPRIKPELAASRAEIGKRSGFESSITAASILKEKRTTVFSKDKKHSVGWGQTLQEHSSSQQPGAFKLATEPVSVNGIAPDNSQMAGESFSQQDDQSLQSFSTIGQLQQNRANSVLQNGEDNTNLDNPIEATVGPGMKKYNVLTTLMSNSLKRQFGKHFSNKTNKMTQFRLQKEYKKTYNAKTIDISNSLKPVKFRDQTKKIGHVPYSDTETGTGTGTGRSNRAMMAKNYRISDQSFQTSSSDSSVPSEHSSFNSRDSSSESAHQQDIFKQTRTNTGSLKRKKLLVEKTMPHPILPKGMSKHTLYDDELFDKWFKDCFRVKQPSFEHQVQKKILQNQRAMRRRRARQDKHTKGGSSDDSVGFSSDQDQNNSDSSSTQEDIGEDGKKTLAQEFEDQLKFKKSMEEMKNINSVLVKEQLMNQEQEESDEELADKENLQKLIDQVRIVSEDYTLNLSEEVDKILEYFNVTIVGTKEKRTAKRSRLVKHFMRQFYKFIKLEKEWAFPRDKKPTAAETGMTEKQMYEMAIERKEKALIKDLKMIGLESIEALKEAFEQRVLCKLMDKEEEELQMQLIEAKGIALKELLDPKGPSKEILDFQNKMQPSNRLEEIKLEPNQNESMSPQRKFLTNKFGKDLINELKRSKLDNSGIGNYRRLAIAGVPGEKLDIDTVGMIRTQKMIQKLKLTKAFVSASPIDSPKEMLSENRSSVEIITTNISAKEQRKLKDAESKKNLEVFDSLNIFEETQMQQDYYKALRVQQPHEFDRDTQINSQFSLQCLKVEKVQDLPIFTKIKDNVLSLTGYRLNNGVCKALGSYLAESNWRIDKTFMLKELVLDNNDISDNDFAEILAGLAVQGQLQQLTYGRNQFGLESVYQIQKLIESQKRCGLAPHQCLSHIRLIKVKVSSENLQHLFTDCFTKMSNLTQVKLQGIYLGTKDLTDDLMAGLKVHTSRLQLLDLKETQLSIPQLEKITEELANFKSIYSLDLSNNSVREPSEALITNLCNFMKMLGKLNHISLSYMALDFRACIQIVKAASQSDSLCALHLSGNKLHLVQQQFLVRVLGIPECELDTFENQQSRIGIDEIKTVLKYDNSNSVPDTPRHRMLSSERKVRRRMPPKNAGGLITGGTKGIIDQEIIDNAKKFVESRLSVQQIVNAFAARDNKFQIAKMQSQQDGQSGLLTYNNNLVFTRQVFNPELVFNQDVNKGGVVHDYETPFQWHVSQQSDGCYICEQWRYCILYFSRKQVIEGDFFTSVQNPWTRVSLDKVCGFSKKHDQEAKNDLPWLIGSFTALSKSQFVPISEYFNLLTWRLKKSRYLKMTKKINKAIGKNLSSFFSKTLKSDLPLNEINDRVLAEQEHGNIKQKKRQQLAKKSILLPEAGKKESLTVSKQQIFNESDSSDFSVDEHSTLLELMQKLKKVDPETLILNFSQTDDPELEESEITSEQMESDSDVPDILRKRQDFFAFAAYVPPGKHVVLIRDTETKKFGKHQTLSIGRFKNERNGAAGTSVASLHSSGSSQANSARRNVMGNRRSVNPTGSRASINNELSGGGNDSSAVVSVGLKRLENVTENKSEYYYKHLLVEPRKNSILKTYSNPFKFENLPKRQMKKHTEKLKEKTAEKRTTNLKDSVFRDWIEETEVDRIDFFQRKVFPKFNFKQPTPPPTRRSSETSEENQMVEIPGAPPKKPEVDPPIFGLLDVQAPQIEKILQKNFALIREFFFDVAALDSFTYPLVEMNHVTDLLVQQGTGYLKVIERPQPETPPVVPGKSAGTAAKKGQKSGSRRGSVMLQPVAPKVKEDLNPKEVYIDDMTRTASQVLNGHPSRWLVPGESRINLQGNLVVDVKGFIAMLIKMAVIWSRGKPTGLKSVPEILETMVTEDIPLLKQAICIQNKLLQQSMPQISLPYELAMIDQSKVQASITTREFRQRFMFGNPKIDLILKQQQQLLIGLFLRVANKSTQKFEFDQCGLVMEALNLNSFRLMKNKPTRKPDLVKVVKTAINAETGENARPQTYVLTLQTIQLCFTRSKMHRTIDQATKKPARSPPALGMGQHKKRKIALDEQKALPEADITPPVDYKRLNFVEWLEFLCRVASSTFVVDSHTALKTKNAAILRLVEEGKKPFEEQLAGFLSLFLKQLVICYTKPLLKSLKPKELSELRELFDKIPDFEEILEALNPN